MPQVGFALFSESDEFLLGVVCIVIAKTPSFFQNEVLYKYAPLFSADFFYDIGHKMNVFIEINTIQSYDILTYRDSLYFICMGFYCADFT